MVPVGRAARTDVGLAGSGPGSGVLRHLEIPNPLFDPVSG